MINRSTEYDCSGCYLRLGISIAIRKAKRILGQGRSATQHGVCGSAGPSTTSILCRFSSVVLLRTKTAKSQLTQGNVRRLPICVIPVSSNDHPQQIHIALRKMRKQHHKRSLLLTLIALERSLYHLGSTIHSGQCPDATQSGPSVSSAARGLSVERVPEPMLWIPYQRPCVLVAPQLGGGMATGHWQVIESWVLP